MESLKDLGSPDEVDSLQLQLHQDQHRDHVMCSSMTELPKSGSEEGMLGDMHSMPKNKHMTSSLSMPHNVCESAVSLRDDIAAGETAGEKKITFLENSAGQQNSNGCDTQDSPDCRHENHDDDDRGHVVEVKSHEPTRVKSKTNLTDTATLGEPVEAKPSLAKQETCKNHFSQILGAESQRSSRLMMDPGLSLENLSIFNKDDNPADKAVVFQLDSPQFIEDGPSLMKGCLDNDIKVNFNTTAASHHARINGDNAFLLETSGVDDKSPQKKSSKWTFRLKDAMSSSSGKHLMGSLK